MKLGHLLKDDKERAASQRLVLCSIVKSSRTFLLSSTRVKFLLHCPGARGERSGVTAPGPRLTTTGSCSWTRAAWSGRTARPTPPRTPRAATPTAATTRARTWPASTTSGTAPRRRWRSWSTSRLWPPPSLWVDLCSTNTTTTLFLFY